MINRLRLLHRCTLFLLLAGALVSCTKLGEFHNGLTSTGNPAFVVDNVTYSHVLKQVSLTTMTGTGGNGTPDLMLSLAVDTGRAGFSALTSFCDLSTTKPCVCELNWTEVNTVGGGSTSVPRTKRLVATEVQAGLVKCQMTQSFWNEIATGTTIRVNIVPVSPNISGLNCQSIGYKKGTTVSANGDFLDDTLTPFRNIHRYTCFSKRQTAYEILNQFQVMSDPNNSNHQTPVIIGSQFCTGATGNNNSTSCSTPRNGFSAQSYYRNLYIRSDKLGEVNSTNSFYDCPKVVEPIRYSAGQTIPSAEKGKYWPLDTTFALATDYSSEWSVGVRAGTVLYKSGDANSVSDACVNEDTAKRLSEKGIIIKCLGYAKPPKPDGTCGTITDSNGRVRPMVRLRRYRVVYPGTFQPNGQVDSGSAEADEVYVADRLVVGPDGVPTGSMIYGPKPCNFAWFDHEGMLKRAGGGNFDTNFGPTVKPSYVATSSYEYNDPISGRRYSVNPDGVVLPNYDRDGTIGNAVGPSCAATIPLVQDTMGVPSVVRLLTTYNTRSDFLTIGTRRIYLSEVHIKPVDPWSPNYVEDTSFQACAPLADPYLEPPLHFYKKDANTVGWCSKVYPTQNPYWADLNARKKPQGYTLNDKDVGFSGAGIAPAVNYTSHDKGAAAPVAALLDGYNSCSSASAVADICLMSLGGTGGDYPRCLSYLNFSGTRATCDRTATFDVNQDYRGFPLQAEDKDINAMLSQDLNKERTFSCQYSVHRDPTKVGQKIPLSGCCGLVSGAPVLQNILTGGNETSSTLHDGAAGHLEPFYSGAVPNIRFCGNPVEIP